MRSKLGPLSFLTVVLLAVSATVSGAQDAPEASPSTETPPKTPPDIDRIRLVLQRQLAQQPENRALRFDYARALFQSGQHDAARAQIRALIRSSRSADETARLRQAYGQVVKADPLKLSASFALLPSTNINRVSSNPFYDSLLGRFVITDGGTEKSGVGVRLGATARYETVLSGGQTLAWGAALTRVQYPEDRLSLWSGTLSADLGWHSGTGVTGLTPYVTRTLYDAASGGSRADSLRYGLSLSRQHYLSEVSSVTATLRLEQRDYDERDYLDGPFASVGLAYDGRVDARWSYRIAATLGRQQPEQGYLVHNDLRLRGEAFYRLNPGTMIGASLELGGAEFEGQFPALGRARRDRATAIGVSYVNSRFAVRGLMPRISCEWRVNRSNVALYEFDSTDCALALQRRF